MRELSFRVIVITVILTIILAIANAFLALKLGMLTSASIPAAILSMGILRFFKNPSIFENNLVQTAASAGEAVAGGIVYTVPALVIIGYWQNFNYWQNFFIAFSSGILGVLFSVPLRKTLVHHKGLPFPEGVAIASLLTHQTSVRGFKLLVIGILLGGVLDFLQTGLQIVAGHWGYVWTFKQFSFKFALGFSIAIFSAGFLIGKRMSLSIMLGAVLSWLIGYPYFTHIQQGDDAVRYFGIGALLIAGFVSLLLFIKPLFKKMFQVYSSPLSLSLSKEKDMPTKLIWISLMFVGLALTLYFYKLLVPVIHIRVGLASLVLFCVVYVLGMGFLMSIVSGYFSAMVGVSASPGSSVVIMSLMFGAWLFLLVFDKQLGLDLNTGEALVIMLASMVTGIAAIANDNIQDLKVGQIIGATPWKQQLMLSLGVLIAALVIPLVMQTLFQVYGIAGHGGNGTTLPAPTAALLATLTDGFFQHALPWTTIAAGAITLLLIIFGFHFSSIGLSFFGVAIGMYLPLETSVPMILGGYLAGIIQRREQTGQLFEGSFDQLLSLACGLVAGSAVMDVLLSFYFAWAGKTDVLAIVMGVSNIPVLLSLILVMVVFMLALFYRPKANA